MSKGFLDNLFSAILGPKGNMADWQHASRLYVDGNQRLAPKTKYLYHVYFQLDPIVESILPELKTKHNLEIGMLVKSADLPRYTAIVETKNKYNRKKNVQTGIQYQPINISFHDDNYGVTTALLEAYYRYYYADAGYGRVPGAYNKAGAGDNTYMGSNRNQYKYGLDNDISVPFFQNIQITQLAKKTFTTYRIVNPIITDWQHDTVDNSVSDMMTNNITVAYEAVHYERGVIEAGSQNNPTGFGSQEHYDKQPSPISLLGGGQLGVGATLGAATDIYDYISKGTKFNSPLEAGLGAFQLVRNLQNLNLRDLQNEIIDIGLDSIENATGTSLGGADINIPNSGSRENQTTVANPDTTQQLATNTTRSQLENNPAELDDAAFQIFAQDYQNGQGTGGINGARTAWNSLPTGTKDLYKDTALDRA